MEGASCPWGADGYTLAPHKFKIHGQNGIGNVELPRAKAQKSAVSAVDFILDSARRYGPDLALVATAPLTNLANAIAKDKNAVGRIGRISIMGGALTVPGNRTPFAEANICDDARAARAVMESGIPLTPGGPGRDPQNQGHRPGYRPLAAAGHPRGRRRDPDVRILLHQRIRRRLFRRGHP